MKIAIGVPTNNFVNAAFAFNLVDLVKHTIATGIEVDCINMDSCVQFINREAIATEAISKGYDYLLFIDSDMTFPADALMRLLSHNEDIVAVNYSARRGSYSDTANITGLGPKGLARAKCCGFGLFLIRTTVLAAVKKPRFDTPWLEEQQQYLGEDYSFCYKLLKQNKTIYIDIELSEQIGHQGLVTLKR